jgi:5-methylcytosine-specific restriction endonuclease McrA
MANAFSNRSAKVRKKKNLKIAERDEWTCQICKKPVDPALPPGQALSASVDHIVPREDGGKTEDDNLQLTHVECNLRRDLQRRAPK